ncbi:MAG: hypothetical protein GX660_25565 [Clostridiaceae bacterium]|nr:hypothetical protein [Clostridiaceae bacterium]
MKGECLCPECGTKMQDIGGLLNLECPNCGAEGYEEYDELNKRFFIKIAKEYSYEEIYSDPVKNEPECCKACGGPFPQCMTSCKIFDD